MKKSLKLIIFIFLFVLILIGCAYLALGYYYRDGFSYGTYINGVYCTGLTPQNVNDIISRDNRSGVITISYEDNVYCINKDDIAYSVDYLASLQAYKDSQNPYLWIENLNSDAKNRVIEPIFSYDDDLLMEQLESLKLDSINAPHRVEIEITKDGHYLNNSKLNVPDVNKCFEVIGARLLEGENNIVLDKTICEEPVYTKEDEYIFKLYDSLEEYLKKIIEFDFGSEKIILNEYEMISLLDKDNNGYPYLDDNGDLAISEESIEAAANDILSGYNTYHNHTFKTHNGNLVYLDHGTYGNEFDVKPEIDKLIKAFDDGFDEYLSEIELKNTANYIGVDDIGDTYLEISLDDQHWWYYKDGELLLETDIVTGNHSRRCDTPEGVYFVYYMQRNRTLVGANYRSFVKYWIAFNKHIGVHDASWREEYGGDIYLTSGSHGCVNTPEDVCSKLYEIIEIGTPVIVYSEENSAISNNIL